MRRTQRPEHNADNGEEFFVMWLQSRHEHAILRERFLRDSAHQSENNKFFSKAHRTIHFSQIQKNRSVLFRSVSPFRILKIDIGIRAVTEENVGNVARDVCRVPSESSQIPIVTIHLSSFPKDLPIELLRECLVRSIRRFVWTEAKEEILEDRPLE